MGFDTGGDSVSRRTVLRTLGTTAIGATVLGGTAAGSSAAPAGAGHTLAGKDVFVGRNVDLRLPGETTRVNGPGRADVMVVSADHRLPRGALVGATNRGTPVFFLGSNSNESLMSLLYDEPQEDVRNKAQRGALRRPRDIQYTFGTQSETDTSSVIAATVPLRDPRRLNTHRFQTNREPSNEYVLSKIDRTLTLNDFHDSTAGETDGVSIASHSAACESAQQGWHCLGRNYMQRQYHPYGQVELWVWGAKATETDSRKDYYGWKVKQLSTPGQALGWSGWQNHKIERSVDFADTHLVPKHGPPTTNGTSTSSFSIGVNLGIDSSPSVGIGGSLGWQWSNSYGHTKISEVKDTAKKTLKHLYEFKTKELVAKNTVSGYPGYRIEVPNKTNQVSFKHTNKWEWVRPDPVLWNYHSVTPVSGTSTWNA